MKHTPTEEEKTQFSMQRFVRCLEAVAFVALMALACLGSLIGCWCYCLIVSGGKEWRGRYSVGMNDT